jgi:WD40 repeat protein
MVVEDAGLFPDGRLVFAHGNGVYVADKDGSNARKLLTSPNEASSCPSVSPDAKQVVFLASTVNGTSTKLFEVAADGSGAREILDSEPDATLDCAVWSSDGNYLIYGAHRPGATDIWALPLRSRFFQGGIRPIQLTNGPLSYSGLTQSRDGRRIFAIGTKRRGELVRYDRRSGTFTSFLSGISAIDPTFSRDGEWVVYVSYPDNTLWRSRADGTDRLQLAYPPMEVWWPNMPQDGRRVAFRTSDDGVYVADMDGGPLRKIDVKNAVWGTLSPDGNSMVLWVRIEGKHLGETKSSKLQILDLVSGNVSKVPSSEGSHGTFWVNKDTLVAAADFGKILTFDFKTKKWSELVFGQIASWQPSPDGKFLYYATGGPEPEVMRVGIADHRVERIASLKNLRSGGGCYVGRNVDLGCS